MPSKLPTAARLHPKTADEPLDANVWQAFVLHQNISTAETRP